MSHTRTETEKKDYLDALKMIGEYNKHAIYCLRGFQWLGRVFTGSWAHSHIPAVNKVMEHHDASGSYKGLPNARVKELLEKLKDELIRQGTSIKENGSMHKLIQKLENKFKTGVFTIGKSGSHLEGVNSVIEANKKRNVNRFV